MVPDFSYSGQSSSSSNFRYIDGISLSLFVNSLPLLLVLLCMTWSGPCVVSGFGHLVFTSFERKIALLVFLLFLTYVSISGPAFFFVNSSSYDFVLTLYHITTWLVFLFLVSNILSLSFVIEVLTGLVTLLLVTSHTPSSHGSSLSTLVYSSTSAKSSMSTTYLFSLLIFFWTSLITTLTLFLFLLLVYVKFLTVDWSLVSLLADYYVSHTSSSEVAGLSFTWLLGLLCVLLKCGVVPFFLWKPTFFKGIALNALFFYIFVFYFTLFLYFINFLMGLFSELLFFNLALLAFTLVLGVAVLPSILYETLNLKSFFAMSSIMNSVIVLFTLLNYNFVSSYFFL